MSQNQFWNLLSKKLAGQATVEEIKELERLIKAYPDLMYAAQHLQDIWQLNAYEDTYNAEEAFKQHLTKLKQQGINPFVEEESVAPHHSRNYTKWLVSAALVISLIFGFSWLFKKENHSLGLQKRVNEVYSRPGTKTKLLLPDSSVVWLNAGSKLSYNEYFGIKNRDIFLTGEAFFDVKKSTTPFIIRTNNIQIKVLGTAFNVRSYDNERKTETSLIRGRVEITLDKRPGEKFILRPNEKLIVNNEEEKNIPSPLAKEKTLVVLSTLKPIDQSIIAETSWVENKLVFQDETFEEVARKLERWYNVKISIKDKKLSQMLVGGGPFENETIQQALKALQIAFNFDFTIHGNDIIITR